tara:strand:+ start:2401 stop:2793 length:393 start_codon:yes stop_codon:yes gene_type:complete
MSYTKSKSKSRGEERENKRMSQLRERAINDPVVHKQLIDIMEEDPELIRAFSKHAEARYGAKWKTMNSSDKSKMIKSEMEKNRIPTKRGGRKTKKAKKTKKKASKKASKKAKKMKTRRRTMRKKTTRKMR